MIRLVISRLLSLVPIVLLVTLIAFLLIQLTPGDPAVTVAGEEASPELLAKVRSELGLDEPLYRQYFDYVSDLARGDLGQSIVTKQFISERMGQTIPVTLSLLLVAMIFALLLGIPGGFVAALCKGRWQDGVISSAGAVGLAVPGFVFALLLVVPLAVNRNLLPATGYALLGDGVWDWLRHLILPAFTLSLLPAAELARQMRGELVDVFEQDFIRTTRAKGLSERAILLRHALRNAAVPVVTVFGLQLGRTLGAAVVVERVFGMQGFGFEAFNAVLKHDFPMIRASVLVSAIIVIMCNLVVDIANGFINPRLRTA